MHRRSRLVGCLLGVAVLLVCSLLLPALRSPVNLVASAAAVALVAVGIRRHRPPHPRPWAGVGIMLVLILVANAATAVTGRETPLALWCATLAYLVTAGLIPVVLRSRLPRRSWQQVTPDVVIAASGAALLAAQVALLQWAEHAGAPTAWWLVAAPAFDVFTVALLVHVFLVRRALERSAVLGVTGGLAFLAHDLVVTTAGQRLALPGDPAQVLGTAGALLFGLSAVQRDMGYFGAGMPGDHVRSTSSRLLAAVPAFVTAPALWVLGLTGLLPSTSAHLVVPAGYLLAGAGMAVALVSLRRAERTAERDPLTNLVNRRGLLPAVEDLRRRMPGERLHLCLVDLDDFKQVNDSRGHEVGDRLLVQVADRLRAAVGQGGVVSRTGGDEFLVVLAESSDGWGAGDLVLTALDPPFDCAGVPTPVSASVGVVGLPRGSEPADVIADADVAMYAAKQAGKGRALTYRPELRHRVLGDFEAQREVRALLDGADPAEVGRLVVLYQPIVALDPVRITGAEALVRWQHPRHGMMAPDAFLHLVEGAGLGARLDEHVMQQAARQLVRWDAAGLPRLALHLNLGIGSMRRPNLARAMSTLVERHGLTPDRFHLEITEHDELPVEQTSAAAFEALAHCGFRISLDDFGVGYTSLTYLRRFPVSVVKLDRSLTSLVDESGRVPLMEGIAALCRALEVRLLAEGVERAGQVQALRALGVEFAQGFHFARPLTAEAFTAMVEREREEGNTPAGTGGASAVVTLGREPADGS